MASQDTFAGKRITVMGLGRFGGGAGVTRWLAAQGADVLLTDLADRAALAEPLQSINDLIDRGAVRLRLGGHNVSDFTDTDLVVANPAVPRPWENRFLRAAEAAKVPVTTEIRLLVELLPERHNVIGVTGSVGKSTTSAMIAHAVSASEVRVHFGGNIGGSLLHELPSIRAGDPVVLELSSAMLHWLSAGVGYAAAPGWSPGIAVVTNCKPNHLDWHADFDDYRRAKQQILRAQGPDDTALLHESVRDWPARGRAVVISDSEAGSVGRLAVPGRHNRLNAAMALSAAEALGGDRSRAAAALATFPGLPHRLQLVGEFVLPGGGAPVRVFNDSKSTTPESVCLALEALAEDSPAGVGSVRLICGGYDKKIDLSPMVRAASTCAGVYTLGTTGTDLADAISRAGGHARLCEVLPRSLEEACADLRPGEALLLSPGCASWDQFTNYEERGDRFCTLARAALSPDSAGSLVRKKS